MKNLLIIVGLCFSFNLYCQTSDSYCNSGLYKFNAGDFQSAIADYTLAIQLDPNNKEAYIRRGNSKYNLQDYTGAIADLTKAIELDPYDRSSYVNRANSKYNFLRTSLF